MLIGRRHHKNHSDPEQTFFYWGHIDEGPNFWKSLKQLSAVSWICLNATVQLRGRDASCAMTVNQHYYNNTESLGLFSRLAHAVENSTYAHTYQVLWTAWSWCWPEQSGWQSGSSFLLSLVWRRSIPSGPHGRRLWGRSWGIGACSSEPTFLLAEAPVALIYKIRKLWSQSLARTDHF